MAEGTTALQLLQQLQQVQAHRASLYSQFQAGFRAYLESGAEGPYKRLIQQLTSQFSAVSQHVRAMEAQLRAEPISRADLADLLDQLQQQEREKLRLTLSWQALRGALAADDALAATSAAAGAAGNAVTAVAAAVAGGGGSNAAGGVGVQQRECGGSNPRGGSKGSQSKQLQPQQQQGGEVQRGEASFEAGDADMEADQSRGQQQQQPQGQGSVPESPSLDAGVAGMQLQEPGFCSMKPGFMPGFYEQQMATAAQAAAEAEHLEAATAAGASEVTCSGHHDHHHHDEGPTVLSTHLIGDEEEGDAEGEGVVPRPSRPEVEGAVSEILVLLDEVVRAINEVLEEVRYAVAELQEEEGG